jgi:ABC-2 type transport system ATP-binding protein
VARIRITPDLDSAVEFRGAGVRLPRRQRRGGARKSQRIRRFAGEVSRDEVWFLREASFRVAPGESLAVVGHEGSGRDQVLRLAAGTLVPDEGEVRRSLSLVPIIGVGGALDRKYTVRQNIYLIGGLLGMLPDEVGERLPQIVERAGVQKILDRYLADASRMVRGRLVWSIAMATQARGFAVSQALIVGQPAFQRECWDVVEEMKAEGVTFLVTSEKPSHLLRFCDRAILLDGGRIVADTTVPDAIERLKSIKPPKHQVHFVIDDDDDSDDEDLL